MNEHDEDLNEHHEEKSKTQIKKEAHRLQQIGEKLLKLSANQLAMFDISDELKEAVRDAKTFRSNHAKRRQIQYIGALMRKVDFESILHELAMIEAGITPKKKLSATAVSWSQSLMDGDDTVVEIIVNQHPIVDRQHLRQLIRNARKQKETPQAKKTQKVLVSFLHELERS